MTIRPSSRNITLAFSVAAFLGLSACAAQHGNTRYGDCSQPCMPSYQPSYVQSYYQVPVQSPVQAPTPLPSPVTYAAAKIMAPPAAVSCPAGTVLQDSGTCLQIEQPAYTPYIPPMTGYSPDPIAPPRTYKPFRK